MKATGIVRRIDDLGRVVIPKEIRRTLRIKEGTPLEIFTDREGEVILKKYSPIGELSVFAKEYAEALSQTTGFFPVLQTMIRWLPRPDREAESIQEKGSVRNWKRLSRQERENVLTPMKKEKFR